MLRASSGAVSGALLLMLSACAAVGPDHRVPDEALVQSPAAQSAFVTEAPLTAAVEPPDLWWHLFDDARLDVLIEQALQGSADLRVAQARLEKHQALLEEAQARQLPSLGASLQTTYGQASAAAVMQNRQPPQRQAHDLGLSFSYDMDLFGRLRRGIEAAGADEEAAIAARDLVRINIAAATASAYADLCNAGYQAQRLDDLIALEEKSLLLTQQLIANGRAAAPEAERRAHALDTRRSQRPTLDARRRNAAYRIATLAGTLPAQFDRALLDCRRPLTLPQPLPVGDGRALLRRRPDLRMAERQLAASVARIGVATADLYPDISLGASLGSTGPASDAFSPLTMRFGIGPLIRWNLWPAAPRARIDQAEAESRARLAAFDAAVLDALDDAESALSDYAAAQQRLDAKRAASAHAARHAEQLRAQRDSGRIGELQALSSESEAASAALEESQAQADLNRAQLAVFRALGGGWGSAESH